ncbi:unnamed protein product [Rhizoctonia solani]|uniref:Uncharacterized protein n=1 Tax=Rhizoctonia solani TaxID=456999 RepID=A0A8H2XV06_9AGAM|nr:unnamed protein product [Rhizoctonia solani]
MVKDTGRITSTLQPLITPPPSHRKPANKPLIPQDHSVSPTTDKKLYGSNNSNGYCHGKTKGGKDCRTKVKESMYCRHHDPERRRCLGTTLKDEGCKLSVPKGQLYCHHHKPATSGGSTKECRKSVAPEVDYDK